MAPHHHRQLFLITIPTLAALLSYLWYKKKRIAIKSDTGDKIRIETEKEATDTSVDNNIESDEKPAAAATSTPVKIKKEAGRRTDESTRRNNSNKKRSNSGGCSPVTPDRSFSRSLSGVDSAPIDIILPREHRAKIAPIISDEDLDLEIEKIKSMKNTMEPYNKFKATTTTGEPAGELIETSNNNNNNSNPDKESTPLKSPIKENFTPTKAPSPKKAIGPNSGKKCANKKNKSAVAQKQQQTKQSTESKDVEATESKPVGELKIENSAEAKSSAIGEAGNETNNAVSIERESDPLQRQSSERDSANHSPSDVMLASPSLSSISDNHSEGSNDSGKGGSDLATPPSRTPAVVDDASVSAKETELSSVSNIYEFLIPKNLVGKLIGTNGRFVTEIHKKTNAHIIVKKHPQNHAVKVCVVEGTQTEINNAMKMVRDKFPLKKYPDLTLEQVFVLSASPQVSLIADHIYLKLVEGVNNDTIVSCMVAPNHLFLQQPTHPTYPSLNILNTYMKSCYAHPESPLLPTPIPENTVCVAQSVGEWYRAMVLSSDEETNTSYVSFLDYGGYAYVENSNLRQIRGDFMLLPFQAAECILANIRPAGDDDATWSNEAYTTVAELTKGAIIYTQVAEYTAEGVPLVLMYILDGPNSVTYLNQELVSRGYAEWITSSGDCEGAVGGV